MATTHDTHPKPGSVYTDGLGNTIDVHYAEEDTTGRVFVSGMWQSTGGTWERYYKPEPEFLRWIADSGSVLTTPTQPTEPTPDKPTPDEPTTPTRHPARVETPTGDYLGITRTDDRGQCRELGCENIRYAYYVPGIRIDHHLYGISTISNNPPSPVPALPLALSGYGETSQPALFDVTRTGETVTNPAPVGPFRYVVYRTPNLPSRSMRHPEDTPDVMTPVYRTNTIPDVNRVILIGTMWEAEVHMARFGTKPTCTPVPTYVVHDVVTDRLYVYRHPAYPDGYVTDGPLFDRSKPTPDALGNLYDVLDDIGNHNQYYAPDGYHKLARQLANRLDMTGTSGTTDDETTLPALPVGTGLRFEPGEKPGTGQLSYMPVTKPYLMRVYVRTCPNPTNPVDCRPYCVDSQHTLYTAPGRVTGAVVRTLRTLFPDVLNSPDVHDTDRETLNDRLLAALAPVTQFTVVSGEDILDAYDDDGYNPNNTWSSCMSSSDCRDYLAIYAANPSVCRLLTTYDDDGLTGRALIWKTTDGESFCDRVYANDSRHEQSIREYAERELGCVPRQDTSSVVQLTDWDHSEYPYLDTLVYLDMATGRLATNRNDVGAWYRILHDTGGEFDEYGKRRDYAVTLTTTVTVETVVYVTATDSDDAQSEAESLYRGEYVTGLDDLTAETTNGDTVRFLSTNGYAQYWDVTDTEDMGPAEY